MGVSSVKAFTFLIFRLEFYENNSTVLEMQIKILALVASSRRAAGLECKQSLQQTRKSADRFWIAAEHAIARCDLVDSTGPPAWARHLQQLTVHRALHGLLLRLQSRLFLVQLAFQWVLSLVLRHCTVAVLIVGHVTALPAAMPGKRRGLVAPQNTFLDSIMRKLAALRKSLSSYQPFKLCKRFFFASGAFSVGETTCVVRDSTLRHL